jgi:hypothetical protein
VDRDYWKRRREIEERQEQQDTALLDVLKRNEYLEEVCRRQHAIIRALIDDIIELETIECKGYLSDTTAYKNAIQVLALNN